jgi:hypothetical protein
MKRLATLSVPLVALVAALAGHRTIMHGSFTVS